MSLCRSFAGITHKVRNHTKNVFHTQHILLLRRHISGQSIRPRPLWKSDQSEIIFRTLCKPNSQEGLMLSACEGTETTHVFSTRTEQIGKVNWNKHRNYLPLLKCNVRSWITCSNWQLYNSITKVLTSVTRNHPFHVHQFVLPIFIRYSRKLPTNSPPKIKKKSGDSNLTIYDSNLTKLNENIWWFLYTSDSNSVPHF